MKNIPIITILISLLVGGVLTILFVAEMNWQPITNCQHTISTARTEGCVAMEYGYPLRFIESKVDVGEQNVVFATVAVNKKSLMFNWAVISGAVAAGIVIANSLVKPKVKPKRSNKKRK